MSLRDKDFMPREELSSLQIKRLKETVERAYYLVPFYRRKFEEAGIRPEDIKSLDDLKLACYSNS